MGQWLKQVNRIWLRFLMISLPILLIPVIILFFIYGKSIQVMHQQVYEKHLAALENSALLTERTIGDIENIVSYVDSNGLVGQFLQSQGPIKDGASTMDVLSLQKDIRTLAISNQLIDNLQIYSVQNEILLDSTTVALATDRYYGSCFRIEGYSPEQWREALLLPGHNFDIFRNLMVATAGKTEKQLVFAQSLPLSSQKYFTGSLFVYISEKKLLGLFQPVQEGDFLCVLDETGVPLIRENCSDTALAALDEMTFEGDSGYFIKAVDGKETFVTFFKGNNNWNYVAALPAVTVLESLEPIRKMLILMICFALIGGGILLLVCSAQLSKPLEKISRVLFPVNKELSYVDFAAEVSDLVKHNEDIKSRLNEQLPALKASVFYNLLLGDLRDRADILESFAKIDVDLSGNCFIILIVSLNDMSPQDDVAEITGQKMIVGERLSGGFANLKGLYNLDYERIVLLIASREAVYSDAVSVVEGEAAALNRQLSGELNLSLSFSGDICEAAETIPKAFCHAQAAMNYSSKNAGHTVLWYGTGEGGKSTGFYFPVTAEAELLSAVKAGKLQALASVFDKLERRNMALFHDGSNVNFLNLLSLLRSSLMRLLSELGETALSYKTLCESGKPAEAPPEQYERLKEAFMEIADSNRHSRNQKESGMKKQLRLYVIQHFADPNISLTSVADEFQITEVYLSRLFKQKTGENFSKYVEKLRIEEAKRLLGEGVLTRNEIAKKVGYNSPQVFRRAYKRYFSEPE